MFFDNPDEEFNAGLLTVNNTLQKATSTDNHILLTGHTTDTLGFVDKENSYTPFNLEYDNSGYIIALNSEGSVEWYYENESETALSFIRAVTMVDDKIYVAHDQVWSTDILVLSESGQLLKEFTWEGVSVYNITADEDDNIYISGNYDFDLGTGNISLETDAELLPEPESMDAYLAKYDSELNHLWSQTITGDNIDTGVHSDVDDAGNVFLTGCIQRDGIFDKGGPNEVTFNASGFEDVFVAKYSTNGELVYANTMGGSSSDIGLFVNATDEEVALWGLFRNTIDVDFDEANEILYTDENEDEDESYFFVSYKDNTIVNSEEVNSPDLIRIYPNPANSLLYLDFDKRIPENSTMLITDMLGQTVAEFSTVKNSIKCQFICTWNVYNANRKRKKYII